MIRTVLFLAGFLVVSPLTAIAAVSIVTWNAHSDCDVDMDEEVSRWDPGEMIVLSVTVSSDSSLTGVTGTLSTVTPLVTILDTTSDWPDLTVGKFEESSPPHFTVAISPAMGCLETIDFVLDLTANEGSFSIPFSQMMGTPQPGPDTPVGILDNFTVTSRLTVVSDVTITRLRVFLDITHTWVGDLTVILTSPAGTQVTVLDRPGLPAIDPRFGCGDDNLEITFSDTSGRDLEVLCDGNDPWFRGLAKPFEPLAAFVGESSLGTWRIDVSDAQTGDGGLLGDWSLQTTPPLVGACELCTGRPQPAELAATFGATLGTWLLSNNTSWSQIDIRDPALLAIGDLDQNGVGDLVSAQADGVEVLYDGVRKVQVHSSVAELIAIGELDGVGLPGQPNDLLVDFGTGSGLWSLLNDTTWTQVHTDSAVLFAVGDLDGNGIDDLVVDFGPGNGLYTRMNAIGWNRIDMRRPESLTIGDLDGSGRDDLIVDFGADGLEVLYDNASVWTPIHQTSAGAVATGDLNGTGKDDLIVDFGSAFGIWVLYDNSVWAKIHDLVAETITTGDLDGDGRDEAVFDFGPATGLQSYDNDTNWRSLHPQSTGALAIGGLD